jgi:signal transduction histidine kinase
MEIIQRNTGRLRRLVDAMLDFARLERDGLVADLVPVDLAALTRGIPSRSHRPSAGPTSP